MGSVFFEIGLFSYRKDIPQKERIRMSIIKVEHLTFAYPDQPEEVFDDVNYTLDTDWKTGLIGRKRIWENNFPAPSFRRI